MESKCSNKIRDLIFSFRFFENNKQLRDLATSKVKDILYWENEIFSDIKCDRENNSDDAIDKGDFILDVFQGDIKIRYSFYEKIPVMLMAKDS